MSFNPILFMNMFMDLDAWSRNPLKKTIFVLF